MLMTFYYDDFAHGAATASEQSFSSYLPMKYFTIYNEPLIVMMIISH